MAFGYRTGATELSRQLRQITQTDNSSRRLAQTTQADNSAAKRRCSGGFQILTIGSELRVISPPGFGPAQALGPILTVALTLALSLALTRSLAGSSDSNGPSG